MRIFTSALVFIVCITSAINVSASSFPPMQSSDVQNTYTADAKEKSEDTLQTRNQPRSVSIQAESDLVSTFPDANFRSAVFKEVKGLSGATIEDALAQFTGTIKARKMGIKNAKGLELLIHAEEVDLRNNEIEDWSMFGFEANESYPHYGTLGGDAANMYLRIGGNPFKKLPSTFGNNLVIEQAASTHSNYAQDIERIRHVRTNEGQTFGGSMNIARCKMVDNITKQERVLKLVQGINVILPENIHANVKVDNHTDEMLAYSGVNRNMLINFGIGTSEVLHYGTSDENGTITYGSQSFKYYITTDYTIYDQMDIKQNSLAGRFLFTKYGPDGVTPLAGAKYDLYFGTKETGTKIASLISGSDGTFSMNGLKRGDYNLYETKAPEGYKLNPNPVLIRILEDSNGGKTGPEVKLTGGESTVVDDAGTTFTAGTNQIFFTGKMGEAPVDLTMNGAIPADVEGDVQVIYSSIDGESGTVDIFPDANGSLQAAEDSINAKIQSGVVTGPVSVEIIYHDATVAHVEVSQKDEFLPVEISGEKVWIDNNNSASKRPKEIVVNILQNNKKIASQTVTSAMNWKYNFTDLPKVDTNFKEYIYSIEEVSVPGYTTSYSGSTIKNTIIPTPPIPNEPEEPEKPPVIPEEPEEPEKPPVIPEEPEKPEKPPVIPNEPSKPKEEDVIRNTGAFAKTSPLASMSVVVMLVFVVILMSERKKSCK